MRYLTIVFIIGIIAVLAVTAIADTVIEPLAMGNKALGGARFNTNTAGVEGGVGLNNIGLLVRSWGTVTYVNETSKFFYIDDGANLLDGSTHVDELNNVVPNVGVRVSYANLAEGNVITPPVKDSKVGITGIISTFMLSNKIRPVLRPRNQSDITSYYSL